jgi:SAM-dependent methyltransferase
MKLDIGCGMSPINGYTGVDISDYGNNNIVAFNLEDIPNKLLPFGSDSIDEILCYHTLEHVNNPMSVIKEFYRILKPGGKLVVKVPYFAHHTANVPIHKNYWSFRSKMFFDESYHESMVGWKNVKVSYAWGSSWKGDIISFPFEIIIKLIGVDLYERFFCYVRPVFELRFEVVK